MVTSHLLKQTSIREEADWNYKSPFFLKHFSMLYKYIAYILLGIWNLLSLRLCLCFSMWMFGFLILFSCLNSHSRIFLIWKRGYICIYSQYIFVFCCWCDSSTHCDVGEWFWMSRHCGSCCGWPGRECSCSSVQRRPGDETPWQGRPGSQTLFFFLSTT